MLAGSAANLTVLRNDLQGSVENSMLSSYPLITGPYEIFVPEDYRPGEGPWEVVDIRRRFLVTIVASARDDGTRNMTPLPNNSIQPDFVLCVYGPEKGVWDFVREYGLLLREDPQCFKNTIFNPSVAGIVEAVVSPRATLLGQTIKEIRFSETFGVNALAIHQAGKTYYRELADLPLQSGDTVLIQGTWEQFHALQDLHQNFIIISHFEEEFHKPEKAKWALISFLTALFLMILSSFYFQTRAYNPIPLSVCLMLGALGMVVTKRDGLLVLREVREAQIGTPVLMLTARSEVDDRIKGLDQGADDYLTKPFSAAELLARVRALLRRVTEHATPILEIDDIQLNTIGREVTAGGKPVQLTPKEFAILEFLLYNKNRAVSRFSLAEHVWGEDFDPFTMSNYIDVHIKNLRHKIGDVNGGIVRTIRGVGYIIKEKD